MRFASRVTAAVLGLGLLLAAGDVMAQGPMQAMQKAGLASVCKVNAIQAVEGGSSNYSPALCISASYQLTLIRDRTNPEWDEIEASNYEYLGERAATLIDEAYEIILSYHDIMDSGNGELAAGDAAMSAGSYALACLFYDGAYASYYSILDGNNKLNLANGCIGEMHTLLGE